MIVQHNWGSIDNLLSIVDQYAAQIHELLILYVGGIFFRLDFVLTSFQSYILRKTVNTCWIVEYIPSEFSLRITYSPEHLFQIVVAINKDEKNFHK